MKKLLVFNKSLSRGGAERVTVYLADYMAKNGVPCDILTETVSKNEYDAPSGVERITLKSNGYFSKIRETRKIIKKSGADTVLVMGVSNSIYVIPATFGLRVKVVISERNDPNHFLGKTLVKKYSRFLMRFADGFVFQTPFAKEFYNKKLKGRGEVIFNPLFTDVLPEVYTGERKKEFVNLGRLHEQKNQAMLIKAFSKIADKHKDFNLAIYGEGKLYESLQALIEEKGLKERVNLPGNKPNVQEFIKDSYAFVLSSNFEGMPNALIEAMALGLPCISTDCPGALSLINDGENGLIVKVKDEDALTLAMDRLASDKALAEKVGKNAVAVRETLNFEVIGKKWLDYLKSI